MEEVFVYKPNGVCSSRITITIKNNVVIDLIVNDGCAGNSLGIAALVKGMNIDDVINQLKDIKCGRKITSCPDQIAMALIEYKKSKKNIE